MMNENLGRLPVIILIMVFSSLLVCAVYAIYKYYFKKRKIPCPYCYGAEFYSEKDDLDHTCTFPCLECRERGVLEVTASQHYKILKKKYGINT
jgi:hypothetical protein